MCGELSAAYPWPFLRAHKSRATAQHGRLWHARRAPPHACERPAERPLPLAPLCRRRLLPGQRRYGEYFARLLRDDEQLPATFGQPLLLSQVVCSKLGCFADGGIAPDSPARATSVVTARTLLAVFQRGRQVWSQGAMLAAMGEEVRQGGRGGLVGGSRCNRALGLAGCRVFPVQAGQAAQARRRRLAAAIVRAQDALQPTSDFCVFRSLQTPCLRFLFPVPHTLPAPR